MKELEHIYYPEPLLDHKLNVVFIDFRKGEHFEYIIKNSLIKLKGDCIITFVCGPNNYQFVKDLCNDISENIYIIKRDKNIKNVQDYNRLCYDLNFWKKLKGDKILIHQFDAFILNSNINDFINYDYIGGYWFNQRHNTHVGNGGLSLRTKNVIIKILKERKLKKYLMGDSFSLRSKEVIINILENYKLINKIPEDIFFGNVLKNNTKYGKLAPDNIAKNFSIEGSFNSNKFGCHKFWRDG